MKAIEAGLKLKEDSEYVSGSSATLQNTLPRFMAALQFCKEDIVTAVTIAHLMSPQGGTPAAAGAEIWEQKATVNVSGAIIFAMVNFKSISKRPTLQEIATECSIAGSTILSLYQKIDERDHWPELLESSKIIVESNSEQVQEARDAAQEAIALEKRKTDPAAQAAREAEREKLAAEEQANQLAKEAEEEKATRKEKEAEKAKKARKAQDAKLAKKESERKAKKRSISKRDNTEGSQSDECEEKNNNNNNNNNKKKSNPKAEAKAKTKRTKEENAAKLAEKARVIKSNAVSNALGDAANAILEADRLEKNVVQAKKDAALLEKEAKKAKRTAKKLSKVAQRKEIAYNNNNIEKIKKSAEMPSTFSVSPPAPTEYEIIVVLQSRGPILVEEFTSMFEARLKTMKEREIFLKSMKKVGNTYDNKEQKRVVMLKDEYIRARAHN